MTTKNKKVAIVGAGLAGLSAGSYLARNGFDVEIFEMHDIPGGQCTSWKNGKYTFDACVHWLIGTKKGEVFNKMWNELGALENIDIIDHDRFLTVYCPNHETMTFYIDPDKLEAELLRFSPEDEMEIRKFVNAIRYAAKMKMLEPQSASDKKSIKDLFKVIRFMFQFMKLFKWLKISSREYGEKFKKPELAYAISNLFAPDFAMLFIIMTFGWLKQGNAGYPVGGSLNFSKNIAANCEKYGATIRYKSKVKKINVKNAEGKDCVTGIELENGQVVDADYVISAADGIATLDHLLGAKYHHPRLKMAWKTLPLFEPLFYISLGLDGALTDQHSVSGTGVLFKEPLDTGDKKITSALLHSMAFDPTLAPSGKSVVEIMCTANFDFWNNLKNESKEKYKREKERVADEIINAIDRDFFPGFRKKIEKIDIATPTTWVRYTGVHRGAFEGLQMTKDIMKVGMSLPKQLTGLQNFYLCGQWVEPGGGLPTAAYSGKNVAAMIIKSEGKKFIV